MIKYLWKVPHSIYLGPNYNSTWIFQVLTPCLCMVYLAFNWHHADVWYALVKNISYLTPYLIFLFLTPCWRMISLSLFLLIHFWDFVFVYSLFYFYFYAMLTYGLFFKFWLYAWLTNFPMWILWFLLTFVHWSYCFGNNIFV